MGYHLGRALPRKVGGSDDSGPNVRTPITGSVYLLNSKYIPINDAAQSKHSRVALVNAICHIVSFSRTVVLHTSILNPGTEIEYQGSR